MSAFKQNTFCFLLNSVSSELEIGIQPMSAVSLQNLPDAHYRSCIKDGDLESKLSLNHRNE